MALLQDREPLLSLYEVLVMKVPKLDRRPLDAALTPPGSPGQMA